MPAGLATRLGPRLVDLACLLEDKSPSGRARRMALLAFVIRVASAAIAFGSQIVQARMMGKFEYGIFVFVWVIAVLAGNLSCLGFSSAVVRFLPQYRDAGDHARLNGMARIARIFSMSMATVVALTGLAAVLLLGDRIPVYYQLPIMMALVILPMIALGDVLDGTARANHWGFSALGPTYIIRPILILVFMIIAVHFGAAPTATTAMVGAVAATYLTSIAQWLNIRRRLASAYADGGHAIDFSLWVRVALPIFLIEGFGFLLTNSDVVVVGIALPPEEVGVYFAASKTMAIMQFVFFSVKAAAAPRFSAMIGADDREHLVAFARETARWSFWPSLAVGLLLLAAGRTLLSLFGSGFESGEMIMLILFFGLMSKAMVGPGEVLLSMTGHQSLCAKLYAGALSANIALNLILIPLFGTYGAAAAAAGAMIVEALLLFVAVRARLHFSLHAFASARPAQSAKEDRP